MKQERNSRGIVAIAVIITSIASLLLAAGGCSYNLDRKLGTPDARSGPDGAVAEAAVPDGAGAGDALAVDAGADLSPDLAAPDAAPDASLDLAAPDAAPDASPDLAAPDLAAPDAAPDVSPDLAAPDAAPDASTADSGPCGGASPNACGGCKALPYQPGSACGSCGTYACSGSDSVSCKDPGTDTLDKAPTISQLAGSYKTLSYNSSAARLDWVTSTGVSPDPYAAAVDVANPNAASLAFEFTVSSMGATGNSNGTHLAWVDPTSTFVVGKFGAPTKGVGVLIYNDWQGPASAGTLNAWAGGQQAPTGTASWTSVSLPASVYRAELTYDAASGKYSIKVTEKASKTVRIDASGATQAGLALSRLAVSGGFASATAPVVKDGGWIDVISSSCACADPLAAKPTISQLAGSYTTLAYNAGAARLDWVSSTAVTPEPYASAFDLPAAKAVGVVFEFAVSSMGSSGNTNGTHLAWVDPSSGWVKGQFGAPTKGVGVLIYNDWKSPTTGGALQAWAAGKVATAGTPSYWATTLTGATYRARLTYDAASGKYTVRVVDAASGTVRVDTAGTIQTGLSLSKLAASGGFASATAPVVKDTGWLDGVATVGGTCK